VFGVKCFDFLHPFFSAASISARKFQRDVNMRYVFMCNIYYFCQILAKIDFDPQFCHAYRRTDRHDKGGVRFTQLFYYRPRKRKVSLSADN
jgi:hypothetical protein